MAYDALVASRSKEIRAPSACSSSLIVIPRSDPTWPIVFPFSNECHIRVFQHSEEKRRSPIPLPGPSGWVVRAGHRRASESRLAPANASLYPLLPSSPQLAGGCRGAGSPHASAHFRQRDPPKETAHGAKLILAHFQFESLHQLNIIPPYTAHTPASSADYSQTTSPPPA